jgi:hypothetical protein
VSNANKPNQKANAKLVVLLDGKLNVRENLKIRKTEDLERRLVAAKMARTTPWTERALRGK